MNREEQFAEVERQVQRAIDSGKAGTDAPLTAKGITYNILTTLDLSGEPNE